MNDKPPKAFVSYSWSSPGHCDRIRSYAERLVGDGVDIILDQWHLSEGQDKYAFMERMVSDESVTHVLIFSDQEYATKADGRKAGVGTETQIISKEIYDKTDQNKFIPIVCERQEDNEPCLPVFLKSRIMIDFSSPESTNEHWEKLLRALYGKPIHTKPSLGKPPSYITDDAQKPSLPTLGRYLTLRDALLNGKPTIPLCRQDFIDSAISYADALRVREDPNVDHIDEKVLEDLHTMLPLRDQLIDWLLIETALQTDSEFKEVLLGFLEKLLALKYRLPELTQWNESWFDAQRFFVYEMFLYLIAILIKNNRYGTIQSFLTTSYLLPESEQRLRRDFVSFDEFHTHSEALAYRNDRLKLNRLSPIADLVKERATRKDLPFRDIMQAELVVLLVSLLSDGQLWYPHTIVYASRNQRFPLFVRAAQHKYFERLNTITGIKSGDELREKFKDGWEEHNTNQWIPWMFRTNVSIWDSMNMDALDTIT